MKAVEYLVGIGFLALFVLFWRYVNGEVVSQAVAARTWAMPSAEWLRVPDGFAFHRGHGWARPELTGVLTLGVDDFAQQLIGPLAAVHLPQPGDLVHVGDAGWALEADGRLVNVLAPVSGTVVAVNREVEGHPTLVNEDPYGRGWLLKIQAPRGLSALNDLMSAAAARRWMEQVAHSLTASLSPELGYVYQDGGTPVHGLARAMDSVHWDDVVRRFLLTERRTS